MEQLSHTEKDVDSSSTRTTIMLYYTPVLQRWYVCVSLQANLDYIEYIAEIGDEREVVV